MSLGLDKCEWLQRKDSSLTSFLPCVRVQFMYYGSVQFIVVVELVLQ